MLAGRADSGGRVLGVGGPLQRHGQLPQEDQAGRGGRAAAVRHGQLRLHRGPQDVPRPLQAHLAVHHVRYMAERKSPITIFRKDAKIL